MPYIAQRRREFFEFHGLSELCKTIQQSRKNTGSEGPQFGAGDLAYIVYRLLLAAAPGVTGRFADRNAMMGAVDEAKMEYRRRFHEPAEDRAIAENGDIA